MIKIDSTITSGFIVLGSEKENKITLENVKLVSQILETAEKNSIIFTTKLTNALLVSRTEELKVIVEDFKELYKEQKGQFLRSSFASGSDIEDESFTIEDFIIQINHYLRYNYQNGIDESIFKVDEKRKIEYNNIIKDAEVKELNNSLRIIDLKTMEEYLLFVKNIINSPIVFGKKQEDVLQEAHKNNLLRDLVKESNIKVKENLFSILAIVGKDLVREVELLKTVTDILRYAIFVSKGDYIHLKEKVKFDCTTSDKKFIMRELNRIGKKNIEESFSEMKSKKSLWLGLSMNLFPGAKMFNKFPTSQQLFYLLRNKIKVETFNSKRTLLIKDGNYAELTQLLSLKPGLLLRDIDMIIRKSSEEDFIHVLNILKKVDFNIKLAISVSKWIEYRTSHKIVERIFKIKGKRYEQKRKHLEVLSEKRTVEVIKILEEKIKNSLKNKELF